jgi:hypothetical protein
VLGSGMSDCDPNRILDDGILSRLNLCICFFSNSIFGRT